MAEPTCLTCPQEYWIAFVLESQGNEERETNQASFFANEKMLTYTCIPAFGADGTGHPLALVRNTVWLDRQGKPINDAVVEYYLCPDLEAHVNLDELPAYEKLP